MEHKTAYMRWTPFIFSGNADDDELKAITANHPFCVVAETTDYNNSWMPLPIQSTDTHTNSNGTTNLTAGKAVRLLKTGIINRSSLVPAKESIYLNAATYNGTTLFIVELIEN